MTKKTKLDAAIEQLHAKKTFNPSGTLSKQKRFTHGGTYYRVACFATKMRLDMICSNCKKPYADHKGINCPVDENNVN